MPDGIDNAHVLPQLRADELLFGWATGGQVPTVWLQERLHTVGEVRWWDIAIVPVYMSHYVVPMALAVLLWVGAYGLFRRYVWTLAACAFKAHSDRQATPTKALSDFITSRSPRGNRCA